MRMPLLKSLRVSNPGAGLWLRKAFPGHGFAIVLWLTAVCSAIAGPYPPGPGGSGSDAIPASSPLFTAWATGVASFIPGPRQAGGAATLVSYGSAPSVLGPPDAAGAVYPPVGNNPIPDTPVLSLGDGGQVTLTFSSPIADGEGPDFAVFENGFEVGATTIFAELAFVEVSSNGTDFVRFPAVSLTQTDTQAANGTALDPTNLHNFAGNYPAGYGTPFDLAELAGTPGLDIAHITRLRLIDVVGDVKNGHGSRDSLGNWINDPWPTNFQTSGFDLDAVGIIHQATGDNWAQWLADPDGDPDHDGRTNLVEWAVDSAPDVADAAPALQITPSGAAVTLSFHRATRTGLALTLEESPDGLTWATLATDPAPGDISVNRNAPAGRNFYRLRIVRTP